MNTTNSLIKIDFCDYILRKDLPSTATLTDYFFEYNQKLIKKYFKEVDVIYIVSISELIILTALQDEMDFIRQIESLYPNSHIEIISQACIGFTCAVNNFYFSNYQTALIFLLENIADIQQHLLNAIGVGTYKNKNGFISQEGLGFIYLEKINKGYQFNDVFLITCSNILIQEKNISGLRKFIFNIANQLQLLNSDELSKIISFEVMNKYSEALVKGLNLSLPYYIKSDKWLKSLEQSTNEHYLTLKPIIEFKLYEDLVNKSGITIMQIAASGKLAIMNIKRGSSNDNYENYYPQKVNCHEFNFYDDYPAYKNIYTIYLDYKTTGNNIEQFYDLIKQTFKNPTCMNDEYYKWKLK